MNKMKKKSLITYLQIDADIPVIYVTGEVVIKLMKMYRVLKQLQRVLDAQEAEPIPPLSVQFGEDDVKDFVNTHLPLVEKILDEIEKSGEL